MLDKIKNIFNKEKKIENLVSFLVILVITLIIINIILKDEKNIENDFQNETNVELAKEYNLDVKDDLEKKLENILSKMSGVGKVSVLLTYSESSKTVPVYNVDSSTSKIEEKDTSGGSRITETENTKKDVVTDSSSKIVIEKTIKPIVEGAIIAAQGASDSVIKANIISAVEAVTGVATHKIQVFEMEDD